MNNLCFMTNMSSSDIASWLQAVGGIAAVIAAFVVSSRQNKSAMNAVAETARLATESERAAVLSVLQAVHERAIEIKNVCFQDVTKDLSIRGKLGQHYDKTLIEGLVAAMNGVPVHKLSTASAIANFLEVKDQMIFLEKEIEAFVRGPYGNPELDPYLPARLPKDASPEDRANAIQLLEDMRKVLTENVVQRIGHIDRLCTEVFKQAGIKNFGTIS